MNKKINLILVGIGFVVASAAYGFGEEQSGESNPPVSLQRAIALAVKNNRNIQIQEQEVAAARAHILEARSNFLPKLNAQAGYTHRDAVLTLPSSIDSKKDSRIFSGYKNDNAVGLSLDQSLYNGGADIAGFKESRTSLAVQEETLRAKKLEVEFEAKRLFCGLLLAYETERITANLVRLAEAHYEQVRNKFSQGTASRFDALQSRVHASKLAPELIRAQNAVVLISSELKKLLGMRQPDPLALAGKLEYAPLSIQEAEFLKQAYLDNPQMRLKALGIDIQRWSIEMAHAGFRPQIGVNVDYTYRSDALNDLVNSEHNNWYAGITVTLPLFDGFSSKAKVDAAEARYREADLAEKEFIEQIAVDVKRACLDLKQSEAIIQASRDAVGEAQEALKIAEVSYENGEGTNLDILDAQVSLSQIEKNLSEGIYDHLMARAYLEKTRGKAVEEVRHERKNP